MNKTRYWAAVILLLIVILAAAVLKLMPQGIEQAVATVTAQVTDVPTLTPTFAGCAFVWATQDAPELTDKLNAAVQGLNPNASANANLFGENCVYADGHATFGVMETDFYVRLPADDLSNEETLGNWMAQVMAVIFQIPREEIQGNYGFVEFTFEKSGTESLSVRVDIRRFMDEAQGKSGIELFRMFYTP